MSRFSWGSKPFTANGNADGELIAAPGVGKTIWVTDIVIVCGASTYAGIDNGDGTTLFPEVNQSNMFLQAPIIVGDNKSVVIDHTGASTYSVFVGYYIENITRI